jgi:hypothetical protein
VLVSLQEREKLMSTSRYGILKEMYDCWRERHRPSHPVFMPLHEVLSLLSPRAKTSTAQDKL